MSDDPGPRRYSAEFRDWSPNYWRRDRMQDYRPSQPERHAIGLSEYRQPDAVIRRLARAKAPPAPLPSSDRDMRRRDIKEFRGLVMDYLAAAGQPVSAAELKQQLKLSPTDLNAVGMWGSEHGLIRRDRFGWAICPDDEELVTTPNPSTWLLTYLRQHGPTTIHPLMEATGWSNARVTNIGKYLASRQLIDRRAGIWSAIPGADL